MEAGRGDCDVSFSPSVPARGIRGVHRSNTSLMGGGQSIRSKALFDRPVVSIYTMRDVYARIDAVFS